MTRTCNTCHTDKPLVEFGSRPNQCNACRAKTRNAYSTERRERERYAEQVQINRLLNSIPAPQLHRRSA